MKFLSVAADIVIGKTLIFQNLYSFGEMVDVFGMTIGKFAGVVNVGFAGPPGSHGSTMGNRPGSIGH
jgi:ribosomal protein L3